MLCYSPRFLGTSIISSVRAIDIVPDSARGGPGNSSIIQAKCRLDHFTPQWFFLVKPAPHARERYKRVIPPPIQRIGNNARESTVWAFWPFARTPSIQWAESVVGSRNELISAPETSPAIAVVFSQGRPPGIGDGSEKMHPVAEETHRKADAFFKKNAKWAPSGGSKCRIVKHL
jgi:hypothetical protein